jgi:hypothetical protein
MTTEEHAGDFACFFFAVAQLLAQQLLPQQLCAEPQHFPVEQQDLSSVVEQAWWLALEEQLLHLQSVQHSHLGVEQHAWHALLQQVLQASQQEAHFSHAAWQALQQEAQSLSEQHDLHLDSEQQAVHA